jgi:hypothetical protein
MEKMVESYKNLSSKRTGVLYNEFKAIKTFVPNPIDFDYERSYITRYFIRKSNDPNGTIFEVSDRTISEYTTNSLYITLKLLWKISKAPIEDVKEMNRKSVLLGQETMSNLHLYLPNLTQFYKDIEY